MNTNEHCKRILVIAPTPFFAHRGCHVRILEETRVLISLGHNVIICTYHIGEDINGIEIQRSVKIPWYSKLSAGPSIHKFYIDLLLIWTVMRTCWKSRPDVIHAHLHEGVVIGKVASLLFGVPLIADLQGSLAGELLQHKFMKQRGLVHRIIQWAENMINGLPDAIMISSPKTLDLSIDGLRKTAEKIHVVNDGVDTQRFRPGCPADGIRDKLGIPDGEKVVGFLGVLTEYQGVSVLLDAIPHVLKSMKSVHFLIMGYPNVEHYRAKARTIGVDEHVTFTGRIHYEEAPHYLSVCDVAVSPKLLTSEANGKLLNYMGMGLPVVASDTPVNQEILGGLGVYAEVGSPISFANALLNVLSNDEYARELGIQLRQRAIAEYSWKAIGEQIAEIYTYVATKRAHKQRLSMPVWGNKKYK